MRRLKIGIRPQLIILVCFSSLFSLLILALVTAVYFSSNLLNSRTERLEVISQLKTSQLKQSIQFIFYQVYFLSTKETLYTPLILNRAGNNSDDVFANTQSVMDQFLQLLELFAGARLYNLNLNVVADLFLNQTNILLQAMDLLYPLQQNLLLPEGLLEITQTLLLLTSFYFTGPVQNLLLDDASPYFMGITVPVYANTLILLSAPLIAGYLSVLASALNIQSSVNELLTLDLDYQVLVVRPWYYGNLLTLSGFEAIFPTKDGVYDTGVVYSIADLPMVNTALVKSEGSSKKVELLDDKYYAIGFTQIQIDTGQYWAVIIQQARSRFMAPINKLKDIIIGVVIGIGVFMCLLTFPLAVWFMRPITKLREATDAITNLKKKNIEQRMEKLLPPPAYGTNSLVSLGVRTSLHELVMLYGIRLPGKIPRLKKFFKDEFTELSEAFNIMTEELDKQYTHLEDRVKQRTKELELLKIEAETANEAKTVFIANISHELRTPLNGILGMTSIALDERDPSKIADLLRLIHRLGELLLHILTELLTYSKNTLNRLKLEKLNFEILDIVHQVQSIFGKLAQDQRVNLKVLLRPNEIRRMLLFGDLNRIIQVVMNLVSNSLKFTPVDGCVDVDISLLGVYDEEASREVGFEEVFVKNSTESTHIGLEEYFDALKGKFLDDNKPLPLLPELVIPNADQEAEEEEIEEIDNFDDSGFHNGESIQLRNLTVRVGQSVENLKNPLNKKNGGRSDKELPTIRTDEGLAPESGKTVSAASTLKPIHKPKHAAIRRKSSVEINNVTYKLRKLVHPQDWVLQIKVTDTGPGIEPSLQEKIFEPFIQGDQSLSRSYGGTGLGLSICRQLATMMKGTLKLKSEVGKGSEFTFVVPLPQTHDINVPLSEMSKFCDDEFNPDLKFNRKVAFVDELVVNSPFLDVTPPSNNTLQTWTESHNGATTTSKSLEQLQVFEKPHLITRGSTGTAGTSNSGGNGSDSAGLAKLIQISNMKILVAEDNLVNQEVIRRMLKLEGYLNITMACNGQEAIDLLKKSLDEDSQFEMIFMDIQMPKVDGILATREIRQKLNYTGPIIALTAFADESNVKECLASGMLSFLLKPIKRQNLRKVMEEFMESDSEESEVERRR